MKPNTRLLLRPEQHVSLEVGFQDALIRIP